MTKMKGATSDIFGHIQTAIPPYSKEDIIIMEYCVVY